MPAKKEDLPSTLERSAEKVKRVYEKTLGSAHETYDDEEAAHRAAWASVKHVAEKKGDHWELKDEYGPSDPRSEQSRDEALEGPARSYRGVDANKPKTELLQDAREAGIAGRSKMSKAQLPDALQRHNDRATARARES